MKIDLLKIKSNFPPPHGDISGFNAYISSIEHLIKKVIPKSIFEMDQASNFIPYTSCFQKLNAALPLLFWDLNNAAPCTLSITVLCQATYTQGTGRFFMDTIAHSLLPGQHLHLTSNRCLAFEFLIEPEKGYFIDEVFVQVNNNKELKIISSNIKRVCEDIRLTLLGVEHARKLVVSKPLSLDEKRMILAENLSSLIKRPLTKFSDTIFNKTHHLILKAYYEEKSGLPEYLSTYLEDKQEIFDSNIFKEMQDFILLFEKNFACERNIKHLNRTLSYLYFFRKIITYTILTTPKKRYFSFKLMPTHLKKNGQSIPVLAIIIGTNLIDDYETLDEKRVLLAVEKFVPNCTAVSNFFESKELQRQRIRTLYLEIQKIDGSIFTQKEVKELKKQLPKEIKTCIHHSSPFLFSQPNEREVMRNILILSKYLDQYRDLPLVIIILQGETKKCISFTVILVSIEKQQCVMKFHSNPYFKIKSHLKKTIGILNQRHLKKANIFEIELKKDQISSEESSNYLLLAREKLITYLKQNIGEFQDFNGGMIVRQYTTLSELKSLAREKSESFLLESFFYSLTPIYMQCLIPSNVLYYGFILILDASKKYTVDRDHAINFQFYNTYLFIVVLAKDTNYIKKIKEEARALDASEVEISSARLKLQNIESLLFILQSNEKKLLLDFKTLLENAVLNSNKEKIAYSKINCMNH